MFLALFMGYSGARFEYGFEDKAEELPGEIFLEQQEIKKALSGKDFYVIGDEGKNEWLPGVDLTDFWQTYYPLWEDHHDFKVLPHGAGTRQENRFTLEIIRIGLRAWDSSESWKLANPTRASIKR